MERSKKKVAVIKKGVPLTQEIARGDLKEVTGGRNVGCGGPNQCIAINHF